LRRQQRTIRAWLALCPLATPSLLSLQAVQAIGAESQFETGGLELTPDSPHRTPDGAM
jgi:hypothetical protein